MLDRGDDAPGKTYNLVQKVIQKNATTIETDIQLESVHHNDCDRIHGYAQRVPTQWALVIFLLLYVICAEFEVPGEARMSSQTSKDGFLRTVVTIQ